MQLCVLPHTQAMHGIPQMRPVATFASRGTQARASESSLALVPSLGSSYRLPLQDGSKELDVAIVGGGPGGLAAALALRQVAPHLAVRVFEKTKQLRPTGAMMLASSPACQVLEAIYPEMMPAFR